MATVYRDTVTHRLMVAPNAYPVYRVVYYALDIVEILLTMRFLFRLVGASTVSSFARLVYDLSTPLVTPFFGILGSSVTSSGAVFEWPTVIAMVAYALVAYLVIRLVDIASAPDEVESIE